MISSNNSTPDIWPFQRGRHCVAARSGRVRARAGMLPGRSADALRTGSMALPHRPEGMEPKNLENMTGGELRALVRKQATAITNKDLEIKALKYVWLLRNRCAIQHLRAILGDFKWCRVPLWQSQLARCALGPRRCPTGRAPPPLLERKGSLRACRRKATAESLRCRKTRACESACRVLPGIGSMALRATPRPLETNGRLRVCRQKATAESLRYRESCGVAMTAFAGFAREAPPLTPGRWKVEDGRMRACRRK